MYCNKCGKEMSSNAKFCSSCGNEIIESHNKEIVRKENVQISLNSKWLNTEVIILNRKYSVEHIICFVLSIVCLLTYIMPFVSMTFLGTTSSISLLGLAEESKSNWVPFIPVLLILIIIMLIIKNEFMMMWFSMVNLFLCVMAITLIMSGLKETSGIGVLSSGAYTMMVCAISLFTFGIHLAIKYTKPKEDRSPYMNMMILRFKIGMYLLVILIGILIIATMISAF